MNKILFETSYIGNTYEILYIILFFFISFFLCFRLKKAVVTVIIIGLMMIYTIYLINSYIDVVIAYKNGDYVEIEGRVEDYYKSLRGTSEYFTIDGVEFECSSGDSVWGYYKQGNNNRVITEGRLLRIRYISNRRGNTIVYIEQMMPDDWNTD